MSIRGSQVLCHCCCFIAAVFPIWILNGVWVTHTAALHTHSWGNIKDFLCVCVCLSVSQSVWERVRFQLCCSGERLQDYRYGVVPCSYIIFFFQFCSKCCFRAVLVCYFWSVVSSKLQHMFPVLPTRSLTDHFWRCVHCGVMQDDVFLEIQTNVRLKKEHFAIWMTKNESFESQT